MSSANRQRRRSDADRGSPFDPRRHAATRASVAAAEDADAGVALLLIDVINPLSFPGASKLRRSALLAARKIRNLEERARAAGVPVVYVNDNFGRWRSDFRGTVDFCRTSSDAGRQLTDLLSPTRDDYFVLKPMHSAFYETPLEMLLQNLRVHTLVLTGFATDMCVLQTAVDAYMRDFRLIVPRDCVAAESKDRTRFAIENMRRNYRVRICLSSRVVFPKRHRNRY